MSLSARDRVRELTAILSVVSLALVFAAVRQVIPEAVLPRFDPLVAVIPHLNAAISLTAIVTILAGIRAIRRRDIESHRRRMLASAGLFALFLMLYLYRVSLEGPTEFPGPDNVYRYVYLPILAIHILLAMVAIPVVYYALLLAVTRPVSELMETAHARVGRVAATLWLVSFSLGLSVWLMLHVLF
jgi:putative membrane protein